ncbi:MAG: hypothetical protein K6G42_05050 [Lachnospiraceae bacterium]|nr:hypothetical protein [Lachnospiraceae bacterium]
MSSNQLYPFERNRYYPGKMLTSVDFQAEQNYHINKGRFLNGLIYGTGIICGMGVFSLDDLSVLIESGVAIDGSGREIVIDSSAVKKLSAIEGFDKLTGDVARLKVRYKEQDVHSVYSVNHKEDEKEYEYNRIAEGYELFLVDKNELDADLGFETEFLSKETLFKTENFAGEISIPATVCKGRTVKITLEIKKLSDADVRLTCRGVLETPVFSTAEGEHEIEIGAEDVSLSEGKTLIREYWVNVDETPAVESELILRSGTASAFEDETAINTAMHFSIRVRLSNTRPLELVNREIGKTNLEMMGIGLLDDSIPLADIKLVRTSSSYIIEGIEEDSVKRYLVTPGQAIMRSNFLSYYTKDVELRKRAEARARSSAESRVSRKSEMPGIATGTLEIPLGKNAREGDIRYSGEIAHGLGQGNVYVEVGYSYVSDDPEMKANQKSTIYGNPDLFSYQAQKLADVETAVKVLNEKGSFVVAARLLRNVDYLVLSFRWVAIRFPSGDDMELTEDYYDKSISVDTPTVIMGTKESHFFGVRFNNMKAASITYELTAPGSGEISSDGIYTAPTKEGVYEIRIYCTDMPVICTYAYAIVRKKMIDDPAPEPVTVPDETRGS